MCNQNDHSLKKTLFVFLLLLSTFKIKLYIKIAFIRQNKLLKWKDYLMDGREASRNQQVSKLDS